MYLAKFMKHRKFISLYALFFSFIMTIIAIFVNAITLEATLDGIDPLFDENEIISMTLFDLFEDPLDYEILNYSIIFVGFGVTILLISIITEAISLIPNSDYALIIKIKETTAKYTDKIFVYTSSASTLMYLIGMFTLYSYRNAWNELYGAVDEDTIIGILNIEAKLSSAMFFLVLATLGLLVSLFMSEKNVFISQEEKMNTK